MKAIYKALFAVALTAPLFTSCIEEAIPTNQIVQDQLEGNPGAVQALLWGMPGRLNQITLDPDLHYDMGYTGILHMRDVMTEDMSVLYAGGYDWFGSWSAVRNTGNTWATCQVIWNYLYEQILTTNKAVGSIAADTDNKTLASYRATSLAYRAFIYLDAARMYEVLPNEIFPDCKSVEGNDIKGLTLPIITETTTEEDARNNPRATHAQMYDFILGDLTEAVALFDANGVAADSKLLPDLAVAYGLMARLYLWDASYQEEINSDNALAATQYANAAKYARLAITNSGASPLTQDEWLSTTSGFNDESVSSWMFAGKYNSEDNVVQAGGIRTFSSFCCNEENFGYAAPAQGAFTEIGASVYHRMSDRDFRKLSFVAPDNSSLKGREPFLDADFAAENFLEPYIAIKFRPGSGNMDDYNVGAVVAYPLMRVEEMFFIEAEATAHTNPAAGNDLLKDFMKKYRYAAYNNNLAAGEAIVEEIVFQKRVELWGEGQAFFDIKRLNYSVTRWYDGTNFDSSRNTFNTNGRPAWMNLAITLGETNNNAGVKGYNTPDCDGYYTAIH
ncbi:MAG: RagB/SusD family nutrient uptake outer membrane protein [Muribaculaceae bacterium]|nr:RagB/SusD family nutrient uptake outer membrane protein [Muribaculaceae bacterium]